MDINVDNKRVICPPGLGQGFGQLEQATNTKAVTNCAAIIYRKPAGFTVPQNESIFHGQKEVI
jgi:hypothetical protein